MRAFDWYQNQDLGWPWTAYPGTAQSFFKYLLLSQERVKLRTSHLAGTLIGSIRTGGLLSRGLLSVHHHCYMLKWWMWLRPTKPTQLNLTPTYQCSWIHPRYIQVDRYMWSYLECWYRWLWNYNIRCLMHTRRYLRHHRSSSKVTSVPTAL